jgi:kynurenine 3-monooxygenase
MRHVAIAGAGLAGTLLAIRLAQRGHSVDLYERRADPRTARVDFGRSINLALSARGSNALFQVGLLDEVLARSVPMRARAIHPVSGDVAYQPFGRDENEYLAAIERHTLNALLLDAAERYDRIRLHFGLRLVDADLVKMTLTLEDSVSRATEQRTCECLIGTDGTFSSARKILVDKGVATFTLDELAYGYKELPITVEHGRDMRLECLHIWPRRSFLMIANPNPDRSFSCTLFMPHDGDDVSFARMKTPEDIERLFREQFPDALQRMPTLRDDFFSRPTGILPTVRGGPWSVGGQMLLLGDAAHALVPFFAQGMNSAFEDCTVLMGCLDGCGDRWDEGFARFSSVRKKDTDAIADMAMQNYYEIQDYIADARFLLRKRIEFELMRRYPSLYTSMHVLVMFTRVPYALAKTCGALQKTLLDEICDGITDIEQLRWSEVEVRLARYADEVGRHANRMTEATGFPIGPPDGARRDGTSKHS